LLNQRTGLTVSSWRRRLGRLGQHCQNTAFQPLTLFWRLEHVVVSFTAQQRHANLHVGSVGEMDLITALSDGEAVAGIQVPGQNADKYQIPKEATAAQK